MRALAVEESFALRCLTGEPVEGWAARAACRGAACVAPADCRACPVRLDCLRAAVAEERTLAADMLATVRGGFTPAYRARLYLHARTVGLMPKLRPPRAECGTPSGYNRHLDDGEDACDACRAAHARDRADRRAARRAESAAAQIPAAVSHLRLRRSA